MKIISGGQTGVDRAALDVALSLDVPCGGWCPVRRKAEDGSIPSLYPLEELESCNYSDRTRKNVEDSDATVIFYSKELKGGTKLTWHYCVELEKPIQLINSADVDAKRASEIIFGFYRQHRIEMLNIAGPRASEEPQLYDYVKEALTLFIFAVKTP